MSTPGRVTLKQALREYPGDVRSAAARVRDEWRKLTAPRYPRLRLPEKMTPAYASRSEAEERARSRLLVLKNVYLWLFSPAFAVFCSWYVFHSPRPLYLTDEVALIALSSIGVAACMYVAYSAHSLARYGEWTRTPPQQP